MTIVTVPDGGKVFLQTGHNGGIRGLKWLDKKLISVGADGRVLVRNINNQLCYPPVYTENMCGILSLALEPKGSRILVGTELGVIEANLTTGESISLVGPHSWVMSVGWSISGLRVAGCQDGSIWVWGEGESPRSLLNISQSIEIRFVEIIENAFSAILCKNALGCFQLFDVSNGHIIWDNKDFSASEVSQVAVASKSFATAGETGKVRWFDTSTGSILHEVDTKSAISAITKASFGWITAHEDLKLRFWAADAELQEEQILQDRSRINCIAEENNFIAVSDSSLDIQIVNLHATLSSIQRNVVAASVSQDEKQLVTTDMGAVSFWDLETATRIRREPLRLIRAVTFVETSDKLITYDFEGNIALRCSITLKTLIETNIQQDITALNYISNKIVALLLNNSVLVIDPKTLEIVEEADRAILQQPMIVLSEQQWWKWKNGQQQNRRIAFLPQGNVVIQQGNRLRISSGCEPFVLIWDGTYLKPAIEFASNIE